MGLETLRSDLIGRGIISDAISPVYGRHECLLAVSDQIWQSEPACSSHQVLREDVDVGGGKGHAVRVYPVQNGAADRLRQVRPVWKRDGTGNILNVRFNYALY